MKEIRACWTWNKKMKTLERNIQHYLIIKRCLKTKKNLARHLQTPIRDLSSKISQGSIWRQQTTQMFLSHLIVNWRWWRHGTLIWLSRWTWIRWLLRIRTKTQLKIKAFKKSNSKEKSRYQCQWPKCTHWEECKIKE